MSNTKEIAKQIRQDLKAMKGYKFSVRTETYSMGSSIHLNVMKSPKRLIRNMSEIPEITSSNYTKDQIADMQSKGYHQLNQYQMSDEFDPKSWNNGVFLTEAGHNDLKMVVEIIEKYHWDKSDSSVDYFNTNFYYHINLGKWDKEFIDGNN